MVDSNQEVILFPAEFQGGPYDGIIVFLPQPFFEVLQPRGEAAGKQLHPDEASFNMSFHGRPYSPDVTYDRYLVSEDVAVKDLTLPSGEVVKSVHIRIYKYQGVVSDDSTPGDVTLL